MCTHDRETDYNYIILTQKTHESVFSNVSRQHLTKIRVNSKDIERMLKELGEEPVNHIEEIGLNKPICPVTLELIQTMGICDSIEIDEDNEAIKSMNDNERRVIIIIADCMSMIESCAFQRIEWDSGKGRPRSNARQIIWIETNHRECQVTNKNSRKCNKNNNANVRKKINIGKSNNQGRQLSGKTMRNHKGTKLKK